MFLETSLSEGYSIRLGDNQGNYQEPVCSTDPNKLEQNRVNLLIKKLH